MIKLVTALHRREGMSTEAFRAYYENHHRLIGEKYLDGYASRYVRRYLTAAPGNEEAEPICDVLLEIWFEDQAAYAACGERLTRPDVAAEIAEDEEKLFDRSRKRSYVVTECESELC